MKKFYVRWEEKHTLKFCKQVEAESKEEIVKGIMSGEIGGEDPDFKGAKVIKTSIKIEVEE